MRNPSRANAGSAREQFKEHGVVTHIDLGEFITKDGDRIRMFFRDLLELADGTVVKVDHDAELVRRAPSPSQYRIDRCLAHLSSLREVSDDGS